MTTPFDQQAGKTHLFLTADYELFLGPRTGTVNACLLKPAEELARLGERHQKPVIFFVDAMYVHALEKNASHAPELRAELTQIQDQLQHFLRRGHHVQLHLHPQWLDAHYANGTWAFRHLERYSLAQLSSEEDPTRWDTVEGCITQGKRLLESISNVAIPDYRITSFRAGGLCLQPFDKIRMALKRNNLLIDSSVAPHMRHTNGARAYDYRTCPRKDLWRFSENPCVEDPNGDFTEMPVLSFYPGVVTKIRSRLVRFVATKTTKTWGDGIGLSQKQANRIVRLALRNPALLTYDYWDLTTMKNELTRRMTQGLRVFTLLGHPKFLSVFGLSQLDHLLDFAAREGWA